MPRKVAQQKTRHQGSGFGKSDPTGTRTPNRLLRSRCSILLSYGPKRNTHTGVHDAKM